MSVNGRISQQARRRKEADARIEAQIKENLAEYSESQGNWNKRMENRVSALEVIAGSLMAESLSEINE